MIVNIYLDPNNTHQSAIPNIPALVHVAIKNGNEPEPVYIVYVKNPNAAWKRPVIASVEMRYGAVGSD